MSDAATAEWDDAYANGAYIANAHTYPVRWEKDALAFRTRWPSGDLDVVYGPSGRQRFDLFLPETAPNGLAVFVHGGYWLRFDKSCWSDRASGALARGWAVCLPSYDLSPAVSIPQITRQVGAAISLAARRIGGPIRLSGHSAGGHLVTRMICADTPLPEHVLARIVKVVSISGLHDLRPLRKTSMNDAFAMDEAEAIRESSALCKPVIDCPVNAWVGSAERPEFIRQARLLADAWPKARYVEEADRHHFNVIDGLTTANGPLTRALVGA